MIVLQSELAATEASKQAALRSGVPRLFVVESEYAVAMRRAELAWVEQLVQEIRSGKLEWPAEVIQLRDQAREREP